MSRIGKQKKLIIERVNKRMLGEAEMECPKATKDSDLNDKNKKKIEDSHQYGLPTEEAKGQSCANCVAFDISKRMKDCMGNDSGELGYCWMHHFMCSGKKWCDTWVEGGPIKDDKVSYEKQS